MNVDTSPDGSPWVSNGHTTVSNSVAATSSAGVEGLVQGATYSWSGIHNAMMKLNGDGTCGDFNQSWAKGYMLPDLTALAGLVGLPTDKPVSWTYDCAAKTATYRNEFGATWSNLPQGRNVTLPYHPWTGYQYRYGEYAFGGGARYHTRSATSPAPKDLTQSGGTMVLDVLPNSIDGLWDWDVLQTTNEEFDKDADGRFNKDEKQTCTGQSVSLSCTLLNDWDSDDDGLSDGFEVNDLQSNGMVADSDGDGLSDGVEFRLGTSPIVVDTDGDGLTDSAEVSGWDVTLPGGKAVRVRSDPLVKDADGDGLSDNNEKLSGFSPYAKNQMEYLKVTGQPYGAGANGRRGTFINNGDEFRARVVLFNGYSTTIQSTLALAVACAISVDEISTGGYRLPPRQGALGSCDDNLQWSFSQTNYNLMPMEYFTATLYAHVATSTITATVEATLGALKDTMMVTVDADEPTVSFAPSMPQFVRGDSLIVGGTATDATSWVTEVRLGLPGATMVAGERRVGRTHGRCLRPMACMRSPQLPLTTLVTKAHP